MQLTQNIIFDLGGVLLNIDYNKTKEAFQKIGFADFDKMYNQFAANELFEQLETGKISEEDFYKAMLANGDKDLSVKDIRNAWNAMLLDFRKESLLFLNKMRSSHKLFLLSNTNAIHQAAFNDSLIIQTNHASLNSFFTKAYYSHELGLRKPNTDIFNYVLEDTKIEAADTMFIDDSFNNIETAQKLGFKTHLLLPGQKIEDLKY